MKKILVATDFSNNAYSALYYVCRLMESISCTFILLNVFDAVTPLEGKKAKLFAGKKLLDQLKIQSTQKLLHTQHKIVLDHHNALHNFEMLSRKGNLSHIINEITKVSQIDLLVMGSKGETGVKEIFLGSNTIQVANSLTTCPILVVPKQPDYKSPKVMAFVTDFKKGLTVKTIAPLLFLASLSDAPIRVVHINEEEILNSKQVYHSKLLEGCLKNIEHSFHWMDDFDNKERVIDYFLEILSIDLFSMVHCKRTFTEKLLKEPVVKDVGLYAEIPFLILPFLNGIQKYSIQTQFQKTYKID